MLGKSDQNLLVKCLKKTKLVVYSHCTCKGHLMNGLVQLSCQTIYIVGPIVAYMYVLNMVNMWLCGMSVGKVVRYGPCHIHTCGNIEWMSGKVVAIGFGCGRIVVHRRLWCLDMAGTCHEYDKDMYFTQKVKYWMQYVDCRAHQEIVHFKEIRGAQPVVQSPSNHPSWKIAIEKTNSHMYDWMMVKL